MAIVQISRIQHRRGKKNSGTGLPQLASAEFGWAVDTQELFIGNGSVSEGAPYVGNTKIITEHDNILDLANQYAYKPQEGNIWNSNAPTYRSLNQRLDDFVSVTNFGATPNSNLSASEMRVAIQRAVDGLYLNGQINNRVTLYFPAGLYEIDESIKIPPFATIVGAGKDKTIISSETSVVFETVNGSSTPGNYNPSTTTTYYAVSPNQARYIDIQNITLQSLGNNTVFKLVDCANSTFKNVKIKGGWVTGVSGLPLSIGLELTASGVATCENNLFENLEIDGVDSLVYSDFDIKDNTWSHCFFHMAKRGFVFGLDTIIGGIGQSTGPTHNLIKDSKFDMIDKEAIYIPTGKYNKSFNNKFYNVGNDSGSPQVAAHPNIFYADITNQSDNDYFARTEALTPNNATDTYANTQYVPEILGSLNYNNIASNTISIGEFLDPTEVLKVPLLKGGTTFVDYVYTDQFNSVVREGTLEITSNYHNQSVTISDDFNYDGPVAFATALSFTVELADYGNYNYGTTTAAETISILATNTLATNTDQFRYSIRVKS